MGGRDFPAIDAVADKVVLHINVFDPGVEGGVTDEGQGAVIVAKEGSGARLAVAERV